MAVTPLTFTVHDEPPRDDAAIVDAGLEAANMAAAALHEVRPLACFARLPDGEVVGGVVGRTWGLCCEVQWVKPEYRRRGIGTRLVREVESRAMERGCRTFCLETFSFQAPRLYESLGYTVRLEISGFAPGITKYVMVREQSA